LFPGREPALHQDGGRQAGFVALTQAGYVAMGVAVLRRADGALGAIAYYLAAYLLMNLAAFIVVAS
jgi:NADH-quinone oxidoreductase subunit N